MDRFFEALFLGLSTGAVYGLVALALVVVYRGTGHLNFAQGEMGTLSVFVVWWFDDQGVPLLLSTLIGMLFGFALGAVTEVTIIRPLARRSEFAVFVATIAMFLGINAYTSGVWGAPPDETDRQPLPQRSRRLRPGVRHRLAVQGHRHAGGHARHHRPAVRAVPEDALRAGDAWRGQQRRLGAAGRHPDRPHPGRVVGVAGALGALAAVLVAGNQGQVTPNLMVTVFTYATAAAVLGGLDSPGGAVIGGLLIGIGEAVAAEFAPGWIGQDMKLAVALLAIFVVLLFKPSGLFGTAKVERV